MRLKTGAFVGQESVLQDLVWCLRAARQLNGFFLGRDLVVCGKMRGEGEILFAGGVWIVYPADKKILEKCRITGCIFMEKCISPELIFY